MPYVILKIEYIIYIDEFLETTVLVLMSEVWTNV